MGDYTFTAVLAVALIAGGCVGGLYALLCINEKLQRIAEGLEKSPDLDEETGGR